MKARTVTLFFCLTLSAGPATAQEDGLATVIQRAEAGDTAAQSNLARAFFEGASVPRNYETAADWAEKAAAAGDPPAQNLLGLAFLTGLGRERDHAEALNWLRLAAKTGVPKFLFDYAIALETGADGRTDPASAATFYSRAAEAGHLDAAVRLGLLYQNGRGVDKDLARAARHYEGPAAAGHPVAQTALGRLYVQGEGVPQDYARAAELLLSAAEQGYPDAIRTLAALSESGVALPVDTVRLNALLKLLRKESAGPDLVYDPRLAPPPTSPEELEKLQQTARAGDPVAQFQIAWLLANAEDFPASTRAEAARLFRAAAEAGHGPSMINLGLLYFQGSGVPLDFVLGQMWLTLAAAAGQTPAADLMAQFSSRMTPGQITEAQNLAEKQALKSQ
ncbi:tetratricopeptide repeat protein [Roseovarius aestuariivivens]|uniref:tetratricopeptide repeat protein n=1 Tax=Roseovarius aestuariivivens TaxID=1888910 RepID=UPI001436B5E7|nr:SEL1-like repeat protein [Roseovarius aestuariivivens]